MTRLLIRDALIVTGVPGEMPFDGWVAVDGERIASLGAGTSPDDGSFDRVIDARDRLLMPGLVNAHAHSHSSLTRGSAEGAALDTWLAAIEREQAVLTAEQARVGALATYAEALLSGTTTILDMCLHPEVALRAAGQIGIRAVVAPYVASSKPFAPTLERTEALLREAGPNRVWVGLHDVESCADAQLHEGAALAVKYRTGLHLHCAETEGSVARTRKRTGHSPVAHLRHLGALGSRTLLAHCVWVDADDVAALAAAGAHVVHCPHANLKLGSGIAPIAAMLEAGVNVALGSDGAKANNRLDMFDAMKFASLLAKGAARDPALLPPEQVLAIATRHGGSALGLDVGTLAPGMLADLVLLRLDVLHMQPAAPRTVVTNLVHSARGSDVETVLVGGVVVVENGMLTTIDQSALLRELGATGRALLAGGEPPQAVVAPSFWDFSLQVYAMPDMAATCVALQDGHGADVNLLLFGLWAAYRGRSVGAAEIAELQRIASPWRDEVIGPLRAARRMLKNFTIPHAAELRETVKGAELEAERLQQERLVAAVVLRAVDRMKADLARENLEAYVANLSPPAGPAQLRVLLAAFATIDDRPGVSA